jgi:hypothetical protein
MVFEVQYWIRHCPALFDLFGFS